MPKYIVQYEVVGFVDVQVDADSINDALRSPILNAFTDEDIAPGDNKAIRWDWTPKIVYTEEGERVYG